jgi:hypothetical protein
MRYSSGDLLSPAENPFQKMQRLRSFYKLVMAAGTADESASFAQRATATGMSFLLKNIPAQGTAKKVFLIFFHSATPQAWSR